MSKHISTNEPPADRREEVRSAEESDTGMTCSACERSTLAESRISTVFRVRDSWAVIRNIPAMICPNCREEFVDDATAVRLDMMRGDGLAPEEASETMTVPVFDYPLDDGKRS
jgi:YgiT-type zinc finger domain-containing protein